MGTDETESNVPPRYGLYALATGLLSFACFAVLIIPAWPSSRTVEVLFSVLCYFMLLCMAASVWCGYHVLFMNPVSSQKACFQFIVLITFPLIAILLQLLLLFAYEIHCGIVVYECKDQQREAIGLLASQTPGPITQQMMPSSIVNIAGKLPKCETYRRFPPWLPVIRKPIGVNRHLAGKRLVKLPHPELTVLFADCLSPDGLIDGPEDIDWNRHGKGRCNITLCDGSHWGESDGRGQLIFKPK